MGFYYAVPLLGPSLGPLSESQWNAGIGGRERRERAKENSARICLTPFLSFLPSVGGALTSAFSWRSTFYFIAATGGVSLVSLRSSLPSSSSRFLFIELPPRVCLEPDFILSCSTPGLLLLLS